jgi:CubicO group peptidase (beta-lactamase class C family)
MRNRVLILACLAVSCLAGAVGQAAQANQETAVTPDVAASIDAMLSGVYKAGEPGAAVIAVKDGRVVFRKGYGMGNLELDVPIKPEMVFRIGSVTKQFTAGAIMILAEQGLLTPQDDITRFLPDYPTRGQRITIEHLLTHTSGIRNYTNFPEWPSRMRLDLTLPALIDSFKSQPTEFGAGERFNYSNSGYILLGAIIEKASGQSYEDFLRRQIFEPLGMSHSYYGSTSPIIPSRVSGYDKQAGAFVNASYLSMTQPYAAGSLLSSVDDLARWDEALSTEKLLKKSSLERIFTPFKLTNGESTDYGYGWSIGAQDGFPLYEHGGGINGFLCHVMRMPENHVYVALLSNNASPTQVPGLLARRIAGLLIGRPVKDSVAIKLDTKVLEAYVGVYKAGREFRIITQEDGQLYSQRTGGPRFPIYPESETDFFFKNSLARLSFVKEPSGRVTQMIVEQNGKKEVAPRTDQTVPGTRHTVPVDLALYDLYVGRYEIEPDRILVIVREGDHLMAQATGQEKLEIFPESDDTFFLTEVDARITFVRDAEGKVTNLVLRQNGQETTAMRAAQAGHQAGPRP